MDGNIRPMSRVPGSRALLQATAIAAVLAIVPIGTGAMAAVDTSTYREISVFMDVFNRVKAEYVDKVDDKTLVKGAIDGMLAALDPHSSFETGLDYDNLRIQTTGSYGGLGLTVTMEDGAVKVIAPQEDTPGWRAGVKSGDYITHIDGKLIFGDTLDEAIAKMRGKPGTKITLTLQRPGTSDPIIATMVREQIVQKPVKWSVKAMSASSTSTLSPNIPAMPSMPRSSASTSSLAISRPAMSSICATMAAGFATKRWRSPTISCRRG